MVQIIPRADTFETEFAKQLGGGLSQGIGSMPEQLLGLMKNKRERQAQLGQSGVDLAKSTGRNISPEEQARIFAESSELTDIRDPVKLQNELTKRQVAREDERSRMEENAIPERLTTKIAGKFKGETSEDREKKRMQLRKMMDKTKMSPREKRAFLSKKGFGAEETEEISSPLAKEVLSMTQEFPDFSKSAQRKRDFGLEGLTQTQKDFFKNNLKEIFQKNPSVNPLLLRKEFEKKGVDWRDFRNTLNELEEEGILDLSQNEDYAQLQKYLNKPPLGPLDKLLHGIRLTGR